MKQKDDIDGIHIVCNTATCMECDLCNAVNFEERRGEKPESYYEMKSLYGAEALSYYFYFLPTSNRA